jgi:predicted DNA-binding protein
MPSVTSSFRISKELQQWLSKVAERTGKGKNAILVEALTKHLAALDRTMLAAEAQRQSELVSRHERGAEYYELADTSGWK